MSNRIRPPSLFSPMAYTRAMKVFGLVLIFIGVLMAIDSGNTGLIVIGSLVWLIGSLAKDVQRNYVGLVLLTKAEEAGGEALEEHEKKLKSIESRLEDLSQQHNPIVDEIQTLQGDLAEFRREYREQVDTLKAENTRLQLDLDKVRNPPYMAGDL